jgi:hypothetical protein
MQNKRALSAKAPSATPAALQMQAGTTGINANRIYSPAKQAEDHAGGDFEFIRKWVPELQRVPAEFVVEPHTMPREVQRRCGCVIGDDYPPPIVDSSVSYRHAVSEFARVRAQVETKAQAAEVYEKHGSRKRPTPAGGGQELGCKRQAGPLGEQGEAPFGVETAASGRASCRQCGTAVPKGALKVVASGWSRGGRIAASHHLACFVGTLRVEVCSTNRGKCKHSGAKFVKGSLRVGYTATAADDIAWLCLESAASLLPPILAQAAGWTPTLLSGFEQLTPELRVAAKRALLGTGGGDASV